MFSDNRLAAHFSQDQEIHVWSAPLVLPAQQSIADAYAILSLAEQARADRFLVDIVRQHYIISTFYVRYVLATYLQIPAQDIRFNQGAHGKPFIYPVSRLRFNISHAGNQWLMAVALDREVGVDIEQLKTPINVVELAERFFAFEEYQALLTLKPTEQYRAFYKTWTLKEAFIKATGEGLSFGLDRFVVDWQKSGMQCLVSLRGCVDLAETWSLGLLQRPSAEYAAALAVQGPVSVVKRLLLSSAFRV